MIFKWYNDNRTVLFHQVYWSCFEPLSFEDVHKLTAVLFIYFPIQGLIHSADISKRLDAFNKP